MSELPMLEVFNFGIGFQFFGIETCNGIWIIYNLNFDVEIDICNQNWDFLNCNVIDADLLNFVIRHISFSIEIT